MPTFPLARGGPRAFAEFAKNEPPDRLPAMLADLPRHRAVGAKRDAKGHKTSWTGYKPRLDVADGGIPIGCLPASASPRDSQAAIPPGDHDGSAEEEPL